MTNNQLFKPDKIWEIHEDHVETFRGRVEEELKKAEREAEREVEEEREVEAKRIRSVTERVEELYGRIRSVEDLVKASDPGSTRMDLGAAVRELAGDLILVSQGKKPEFATQFADRYDLALRQSEEEEDFRGERRRRSESHGDMHRHLDYTEDAVSEGGAPDSHSAAIAEPVVQRVKEAY